MFRSPGWYRVAGSCDNFSCQMFCKSTDQAYHEECLQIQSLIAIASEERGQDAHEDIGVNSVEVSCDH
jgi:hypothetical protein